MNVLIAYNFFFSYKVLSIVSSSQDTRAILPAIVLDIIDFIFMTCCVNKLVWGIEA